MQTTLPRKGAAAFGKLAAQTAISATATFVVALATHALFHEPEPVVDIPAPAISESGKLSEPLQGFDGEGLAAVRPAQPADLAQIFNLPIDLAGGEVIWVSDREAAQPIVAAVRVKPVSASVASASSSPAPARAGTHARESQHAVAVVLPPSRPVFAEAEMPRAPQDRQGRFLGVKLPRIPFGDKVVQAVDGLSGSISQFIGRS